MLEYNQNFQIDVDAAHHITQFHENIRLQVEEYFGGEWRVCSIQEDSTTVYKATLETLTAQEPVYILAEAQATYTIQCVENAPVQKLNAYGGMETTVLNHLTCKARLLSNGQLLVMEQHMWGPGIRGQG